MKKIVKSVKKNVEAVVGNIGNAESVSAVAPSPAPAVTAAPAPAPSPAVVTTMTDGAVQECTSLLEQVIGKLGEQPPLDVNAIRRATKMRKGGAEVIPKILALCLQHKVTQIGSLTTQEMSDQLKRGDALVQVGLRGALVQKKMRDSAMGAHGRSWQIATTMYTTLRRMAVDDPELALGLADVESFFQTKRTKGKVRANKKASEAKKAAKAAEAPAPPPVATSNGHAAPEAGVAEAAPPAAPPAPVNGAAH